MAVHCTVSSDLDRRRHTSGVMRTRGGAQHGLYDLIASSSGAQDLGDTRSVEGGHVIGWHDAPENHRYVDTAGANGFDHEWSQGHMSS